MFRNLLTPLTSKFPFQLNGLDTAELPAPIEEEPSPEDFDRDARIEEMRIVLEEMKKVELDLEDITQKLQVKLVVQSSQERQLWAMAQYSWDQQIGSNADYNPT